MKKSVLLFTCVIAIAALGVMSGCKKTVSGCTNPAANNYNSAATSDNGSCQFNAKVVFYVADTLPVSVTFASQTKTLTNVYASGTPDSTDPSTFIVTVGGSGTQTYTYTATTTYGSWSGSVVANQSQITKVQLPTANLTFWTSQSSEAGSTIKLSGGASAVTVSQNYFPNAPGACKALDCANFTVAAPSNPFTINFTLTQQGVSVADSATGLTPGCNLIQF